MSALGATAGLALRSFLQALGAERASSREVHTPSRPCQPEARCLLVCAPSNETNLPFGRPRCGPQARPAGRTRLAGTGPPGTAKWLLVASGGQKRPSRLFCGLLVGRSPFPLRRSPDDQQPGDCRALGRIKLGDHFGPLVGGQVGQKVGDNFQPVGPIRPVFALAGASVGASVGAAVPKCRVLIGLGVGTRCFGSRRSLVRIQSPRFFPAPGGQK